MSGSLIPLFLMMNGAFLCLAVICVIKIHGEKERVAHTLDFIDMYAEHVKKKLAKSKTDVTFKEYVVINVSAPILGFLAAYYALHDLIVAIGIGVVCFFIPDIYIRIMKDKNEKDFEAKYLRCLSQLSSSLRSGLSVEQAVEDVCNCSFVSGTLKEEFLRLNADLKFKVPMEEAFMKFAERTNSQDAHDVAAALAMQAEVGGSESKVVNDIANNISSRTMLRKEVNALFMDTSITVLVMDIMPVAIVVGLYLYSPAYLQPFFEDPMLTAVFFVLWIMMIVGTFINRRMMKRVKRVK